MPDQGIDGALDKLGDEIKFFGRAISYFVDLVDEEGQPPKLKQISSTDPTFFVTISPIAVPTALFVIQKIQALRMQNAQIREAQARARSAEAGAEVDAAFAGKIKEMIENGAIDIEKAFFEKYPPRKIKGKSQPQVKEQGGTIIRELIKRIDDGYEIEGDVGDIGLDTETEPTPEQQKIIDAAAETKALSDQIRYIESPDSPVMRGIEGPEDGEEIDDNSPEIDLE